MIAKVRHYALRLRDANYAHATGAMSFYHHKLVHNECILNIFEALKPMNYKTGILLMIETFFPPRQSLIMRRAFNDDDWVHVMSNAQKIFISNGFYFAQCYLKNKFFYT